MACGLLALSLAFVPDSVSRVRRVLFPWTVTPPTPTHFRLVTPTGDLTAVRGEPLTLTAYLDRTDPTGDLPRRATLTLTPDAGGPPTTTELEADDTAAFSHTIPAVEGGFRYRFTVSTVEGAEATAARRRAVAVAPDDGADNHAAGVRRGVDPESNPHRPARVGGGVAV